MDDWQYCSGCLFLLQTSILNSNNVTYYFVNEHLWLPELALNKLKIDIRDFPIADNFVYFSAVIWISIIVRNGSINFDESKGKKVSEGLGLIYAIFIIAELRNIAIGDVCYTNFLSVSKAVQPSKTDCNLY